MKLLRLLAVAAGALFVARRLSHVLRRQLVGMSHPAGLFGAAQGRGRGWLRGEEQFEVGSYRDASSAVSRSWVDEDRFGQAAAPAGGEPVVASASEAGIVESIELDDVRLEGERRGED